MKIGRKTKSFYLSLRFKQKLKQNFLRWRQTVAKTAKKCSDKGIFLYPFSRCGFLWTSRPYFINWRIGPYLDVSQVATATQNIENMIISHTCYEKLNNNDLKIELKSGMTLIKSYLIIVRLDYGRQPLVCFGSWYKATHWFFGECCCKVKHLSSIERRNYGSSNYFYLLSFKKHHTTNLPSWIQILN